MVQGKYSCRRSWKICFGLVFVFCPSSEKQRKRVWLTLFETRLSFFTKVHNYCRFLRLMSKFYLNFPVLIATCSGSCSSRNGVINSLRSYGAMDQLCTGFCKQAFSYYRFFSSAVMFIGARVTLFSYER